MKYDLINKLVSVRHIVETIVYIKMLVIRTKTCFNKLCNRVNCLHRKIGLHLAAQKSNKSPTLFLLNAE